MGISAHRMSYIQRKWVLCLSLMLITIFVTPLASKVLAQVPKVVSMSPSFNQIASSSNPQISITFNTSMDSTSFTRISFAVLGERSGYRNGTIGYDSVRRSVSFTSLTAFNAGERVTVDLARGIRTSTGDSLGGFCWTFRIPAKKVSINFSDPVAYGGGGYGMQIVDMNNDGSPDIVTSSGVILLNNGSGQFNSSWTLPDADGFGEVAVDDFNRDGIMDVVYTGSDGIKIGLGDGAGNFAITTKPFWFAQYRTADLNNDGYPDLVGIHLGDTVSYLVVALNNGAGQFIDSMRVGKTGGWFKEMVTTDIDNDGDVDVVVISQHAVAGDIYGFEGIIVFKNDGRGKFPEVNFYQPWVVNFAFPEHLKIADFNNDGYCDVAVMGDMAGYICLNLKTGTLGMDTSSVRRFWGAEEISPFTCGDINGDGWIDIVKSGYTFPFELYPRYYAVMLNQNSYFRNYFRDTLPNALIHANAIADLDADGDLDIVHAGTGVFVTLNRDTITSVYDDLEQPKDFSLHQNYPNPFNGETIISFRTLERQRTTITIYNILGEEVRKLKDEIAPAGEYKTVWNGTGNNGVSLPSGVYFIRMQSNRSNQFIKAVLIK